jgi:hypothetical protein
MLDDCHQPLRAQLRGARVLDAQQSLRGVARDGRALEGRRIVPPVLCRFMRQPWRGWTRSLTPAAPQGVVHATAAPPGVNRLRPGSRDVSARDCGRISPHLQRQDVPRIHAQISV